MRRWNWYRTIALWQIVGAIIGAGVFLDAIRQLTGVASADRIRFAVIVLAVCGCSVFCGWLLLRNSKAGRDLSVLLQAVQVLGIGANGVDFQVILGPAVTLGVVPGQWVGLKAALTPQLHWFGVRPAGAPAIIQVNLLALIWAIYLSDWLWERRQDHAVAPDPQLVTDPAPAPLEQSAGAP